MKFTDKRYGRSFYLNRLTEAAAARLDVREARIIRRDPAYAAIARAERILVANRVRSR